MFNFKNRKEELKWANSIERIAENLLLSTANNGAKLVQITSNLKGTGKTVLAVTIAKKLEGFGKKTLLADMSLFNPRIHEMLGIHSVKGITDFLNLEKISIKDVCQKIGGKNLEFVSIGNIGDVNNYLLLEDKIKSFFEEVKKEFDIAVIDTPAIEASSFSLFISRIVDGVTLVMEGDKDNNSTLLSAMKKIEGAGGKVIGIVLNKERNPIPSFIYEHFKFSE
jgi:capsular exopolysaccharide synthesis family protein